MATTTNATVLDSIRLQGTIDYQQRVPEATQYMMDGKTDETGAAVGRAIFAYTPAYNEFCDALITRIGAVRVKTRRWKNPLAFLKEDGLTMGDTIEEIHTKLIKAHGYDLEANTLLKVNKPKSEAFFHTVNREDRYDFTVNRMELQKSFLTPTGLVDYVASIVDSAYNSAEADEYNIMTHLFAKYHSKFGFYDVQVDDLTNFDMNGMSSRRFVWETRKLIPSIANIATCAQYNKLGLPVWANSNEMVLFVTGAVMANIDINVIASAFNVSAADVKQRIIVIPEFPINNCQAILAPKSWFVCSDYVDEIDSFYNPQQRSTNYYLHKWGVYSMSPAFPAIMFTNSPQTNVPVVTMSPSELRATMVTSDGEPAGEEYSIAAARVAPYKIISKLIGSVSSNTPDYDPDGIVEVLPDSVSYKIRILEGGGDTSKPKTSKTYVDRLGKLHVQDNIAVGDLIIIDMATTYYDPSDDPSALTGQYTASMALQVIE